MLDGGSLSRRDRRHRVPSLAGAALLLTACVPGKGPAAASTLPPSPAYVDVTLSEYSFDHPTQIRPGRVVFIVPNAGTAVHELVLVALPDDFPPIDEQLRSTERRGVDTVAVLRDRAPGSRGTFASDLAAGRYGFVCFVRDADGVPHSLKGMTTEFQVS